MSRVNASSEVFTSTVQSKLTKIILVPIYRDEIYSFYVVWWILFLLFLNCSAWLALPGSCLSGFAKNSSHLCKPFSTCSWPPCSKWRSITAHRRCLIFVSLLPHQPKFTLSIKLRSFFLFIIFCPPSWEVFPLLLGSSSMPSTSSPLLCRIIISLINWRDGDKKWRSRVTLWEGRD